MTDNPLDNPRDPFHPDVAAHLDLLDTAMDVMETAGVDPAILDDIELVQSPDDAIVLDWDFFDDLDPAMYLYGIWQGVWNGSLESSQKAAYALYAGTLVAEGLSDREAAVTAAEMLLDDEGEFRALIAGNIDETGGKNGGVLFSVRLVSGGRGEEGAFDIEIECEPVMENTGGGNGGAA